MNQIASENISRIKKISSNKDFVVAIRCLTYNHAPYIKEALESFLMQETDFPFAIIVHDDASTDSTPIIIKEYAEKYPDKIFPILEKENQYSKRDGSLRKIMDSAVEASGAKYVAICEGDDYWIDSLKLQKQIDFLKQNPDYGLCCTNTYKLIDGKLKENVHTDSDEITFNQLIEKNVISTSTTVFKTELMSEYQKLDIGRYGFPLGDYPLWLFISQKAKIKHFNIFTSVYRVLEESASHSRDLKKNILFLLAILEIKILFTRGNYKLQNKFLYQRAKLILKASLKLKQPLFLKYLLKPYYL